MYRQLEDRMGLARRGFTFAPDGVGGQKDFEEEDEEGDVGDDDVGDDDVGDGDVGETGAGQIDLASLSDDELKAEAVRRGVLNVGEPSRDQLAQKPQGTEQGDTPKTPWDAATAEADAKLEDGALSYSDYEEYRSRRAFEIHAEQIHADQFDILRPALIESYKAQFRSRGLPEDVEQSLVEIVPEMVDALRQHPNGEGFANTARGEQLRTVTAATIIGLKQMQKMFSTTKSDEGGSSSDDAKRQTAPIRSTSGRESSEVRQFLKQWADVHNGGKTPDVKQVARLKAEYPSIFEEVK